MRPSISEEKKQAYRRHFDEAWYEAKCQEWKMHEYVWDVDQFRYNEKQVTGNYDFINEITAAAETERLQ